MAKEVIKKDGTREPFDAAKIKDSILGAAQRTNLPEERKNEVTEQVTAKVIQMTEGRDEIATSEIRDSILSELDSMEPSVSATWKEYEAGK